jgi:hypothetical protein
MDLVGKDKKKKQSWENQLREFQSEVWNEFFVRLVTAKSMTVKEATDMADDISRGKLVNFYVSNIYNPS